MTDVQLRYDFRFDPRFALVSRPLGVEPATSWLTIDDDHLEVAFGRWRFMTPVRNLAGAAVTGPYAWPKVIGPPHVSLADGGLTLGTNSDAGVCIRFVEPVRGSTPFPLPRHGSLTVTVADPESLAEAIESMVNTADQPIAEVADEITLELAGATASELRQRASELGIRGVSRLRKAELVEALRPHDPVEQTSDGEAV